MKINCRPAERINYVRNVPRLPLPRRGKGGGELIVRKDDEPATVAAMEEYTKRQGCEEDFGEGRFHHEIYLSDVRRCKPERLKTVIRHPIRRK